MDVSAPMEAERGRVSSKPQRASGLPGNPIPEGPQFRYDMAATCRQIFNNQPGVRVRTSRLWSVAFANFRGMSISSMADFNFL